MVVNLPPEGAVVDAVNSRRSLILLTVCLGAFMATLDTSIVNIALPQIARDFHSSLAQISWVMVSYLLLNLSLLLTSGRLGDLLAPGKLYLLGVSIFTGASVLCGLSPSLSWMVGGRALQGVGASLMLGLAPKIIAVTYGEGERGLALGLFSTAFATGVSVGGPLGGVITDYLGWPYIFFINIPICALTLVVGSRPLARLPAPRVWNWRALDLGGSLSLATGLGSFFLGLTWMRDSGWRDAWSLGTLGIAAACLVVLVTTERRQAAPLLHGELWRSREFIMGSLAVILTFAPVMGTFFLAPFFLEQVYGYSPHQTGLLLAVLSVTNALVAPVGGYLADRLGNLLILRSGAGLILLGLASLLATSPDSSTVQLASRLAIIGLGFGLFQAPNLNEILQGVRPAMMGLAASTNSMLKNLGTLLGITLMVTVFSWINVHHLRLGTGVCLGIGAYHKAFAVTVAIAGLNLLANLLPRRP